MGDRNNGYQFLDTLHYMKAPLEEMINTYANRKQKDGNWDTSEEELSVFKLKNSALPIIYKELTPEEIQQIKIEKGEMFYLDFSYNTFNLPNLPDKPLWYDTLRKEGITDEEFERQKEIWKLFKCRTRLDFIVVYAIDDVLHLADVWLGYVELLMEKFHLDLGRFVSLPNFAFIALLLYMYPRK